MESFDDMRTQAGQRNKLSEESELSYHAIIDNLLYGIITINDKAEITNFNKAAEKIFGYRSDEVIGHNVNMLMPEPYHREHDGYINNYLKTGEAKIIGTYREIIGKRKDGMTFPLELQVNEIKLGEHNIFIGSLRDITARKLAEEKLLITQFTLENVADCIHWIEPDGHLAYVNKSSCNLLGYSNEELISMSIIDINPDYTKEIWGARWEKVKQEKALFYETRHRTKDGHIFPIEVLANYTKFAGKEYACTLNRHRSCLSSAPRGCCGCQMPIRKIY